MTALQLLRLAAAGSAIGLVLALALLDRSGASTAEPYRVVTIVPAHAGGVSGIIRYGGGPLQESFPVSRDRDTCGTATRSIDTIRVSAGRLLDVVVFVEAVQEGKPFAANTSDVVLYQKGCRFSQSLGIVKDGGNLVLTNLDPILHNAQGYELMPTARRKFINVVQDGGAEPFIKPVRAARSNIIKLECSAHEFMQSWLFVARNPYYAIVDGNGAFWIGDLPEGQYRLRAWHPSLGFRDNTITIGANQNLDVALDF